MWETYHTSIILVESERWAQRMVYDVFKFVITDGQGFLRPPSTEVD